MTDFINIGNAMLKVSRLQSPLSGFREYLEEGESKVSRQCNCYVDVYKVISVFEKIHSLLTFWLQSKKTTAAPSVGVLPLYLSVPH